MLQLNSIICIAFLYQNLQVAFICILTNCISLSMVIRYYQGFKIKFKAMSTADHSKIERAHRTELIPKPNFQNYLSTQNNCTVIGHLQPVAHMNPHNILTNNAHEVWLSQLPASCIINMREALERPLFYNRIGFYCWHEYDSNPRLIEVHYAAEEPSAMANKEPTWKLLTKVRLELSSGWQCFKLPMVSAKNVSLLKISIVENYFEEEAEISEGEDNSVHLNQIALGYVEEILESRVDSLNSNHVSSRDKTFSDYRKLTSSEKQIKRLHQKLRDLTSENELIKKTLGDQSSIILKLQEVIESLAESIHRLQKHQKKQDAKISRIQGSTQPNRQQIQPSNKKSHSHKEKSPKVEARRIQDFFNDESQNSDFRKQQGSQLRPGFKSQKAKTASNSRHHSVYEHHDSNNARVDQRVNRRDRRLKITPHSNESKHPKYGQQVINVDQEDSDILSEYQGVNTELSTQKVGQGRAKEESVPSTNNKKEKNYSSMLQKLQNLIILRAQKKERLRSHHKSRTSGKASHHRKGDQEYEFEGQDSSDSDY